MVYKFRIFIDGCQVCCDSELEEYEDYNSCLESAEDDINYFIQCQEGTKNVPEDFQIKITEEEDYCEDYDI